MEKYGFQFQWRNQFAQKQLNVFHGCKAAPLVSTSPGYGSPLVFVPLKLSSFVRSHSAAAAAGVQFDPLPDQESTAARNGERPRVGGPSGVGVRSIQGWILSRGSPDGCRRTATQTCATLIDSPRLRALFSTFYWVFLIRDFGLWFLRRSFFIVVSWRLFSLSNARSFPPSFASSPKIPPSFASSPKINDMWSICQTAFSKFWISVDQDCFF